MGRIVITWKNSQKHKRKIRKTNTRNNFNYVQQHKINQLSSFTINYIQECMKKVYTIESVLTIHSESYTVNNINTLPADIHPSKLCTTENDKVLVSGGLLSEFSYLSNYYKSDITYDSKKYASIEHAYQHVRALHFKDQAAAAKIFATKDPSEAKWLSYSVRGFSDAEWSKIREDLMLKLLRIKFAAGSELARHLQATRSKLLAESGKDKFFSCGMPLIHPEILDSTKWKSNVLGKL